MTSPQPNRTAGLASQVLALNYPMSVGVYDTYAEAQAVVDRLSDAEFPVQECMIVGTDLKQVERVTGRLTTGRVALGGAASGIWMGLFVGLVFSLFAPGGDGLRMILAAVLFGAVFGLVWALLGYALTRGRRDFTSVSQVVATRYEVLTEHKHAQQARDIVEGRVPAGERIEADAVPPQTPTSGASASPTRDEQPPADPRG